MQQWERWPAVGTSFSTEQQTLLQSRLCICEDNALPLVVFSGPGNGI